MPKQSCLNGLLLSRESFGESTISDLESSSNFKVKKKLFKQVHLQGNWTFVGQRVIWGKYNIGFGIPIKFPSQRKKLFKSVHKQEIGSLWSSESFEVKFNIGFGIPIEFPSQIKKVIKSVHKQGNCFFCGPERHLRQSTISDLEFPSNFQVKEKNY